MGQNDPFYVSVLFCFMHSRVKKAKLSMVLLSAVDSVPFGCPHMTLCGLLEQSVMLNIK